MKLTGLKNSLKTDTMTPSGLAKNAFFFSFLLEGRQIQRMYREITVKIEGFQA